MKRFFLQILVFLAAAFVLTVPARAFDCSIRCPYETPENLYAIGGLQRLAGCTLVYDVDISDPDSWCRSDYVNDSSTECTSCDPVTYSILVCGPRIANTATTFPYTVTYSCPGLGSSTNTTVKLSVPCCGPITPAACQGGCGVASCAVGTCVDNKCVNTDCPDDPDCVCDVAPPEPDPACSVSLTGDVSPEAGGPVSYDVAVTGDGTPVTLRLSAPGFDDGAGSSTFAADGSAGATFWMYAPGTTGARTLTANATTTEASCSRTLAVDVTQAIVSVTVNAWRADGPSTCTGSVRIPVGVTASLEDYAAYSETRTGNPSVFPGVAGNKQYVAAAAADTGGGAWLPTACGGLFPNPQLATVGATDVVVDTYFTRQADPWFQVVDGDVYTHGGLSASVPSDQSLMIGWAADSSGAALSAGNMSVSGGFASWSLVSNFSYS